MSADQGMTTEDPWADDAPWVDQDGRTLPGVPGDAPSPAEAPQGDDLGALALVPSLDLLTMDDPQALMALCRAVLEELTRRVDVIAGDARTHRPGGKPGPSQLGPELRALAAAGDALTQLTRAMTTARGHVAYRASEVMIEVMGEGRRTARVPDAHGSEITVSLTPRVETSADEDEILDVLGTSLISGADADDSPAYALGVREGMAALRLHLPATIPWKTSALAATSKVLASVGEDGLAARLDSAWARVEVGEPTPKLDVKAPRA